MKKRILLFILAIFTNPVFAQIALIKRLLSEDNDTTRKSSFMPLPILGYTKETGFEFGAGAMYSFYANKNDPTNRSSNIFANASYSTQKTYNFNLKTDVWTTANNYHILSNIQYKKMPFNFYGIGNNTNEIDQDRLDQNQLKLSFEVEKKLLKNSYSGLSLAYEDYKFIDKIKSGIFDNEPIFYENSEGKVFFIGLSQSYDTRNTINYTTKGFFGRVTYQYAPNLFGGNNFKGSKINVNIRNFWSLDKKIVIAAQGLVNITNSNHTPFYMLSQMGNDENMRGYYTGRYRDKNLATMQVELRYRYNSRFGAVVFGGTGTVWGDSKFKIQELKPNYGAGFRYFFDPAKGLSVRLDYGIGDKRFNEKRQTGFYISMSESF